MKRAQFIEAARHEFLAEVSYYYETQPGLGGKFIEAVEAATDRALAFPQAGPPSAANTRRVILNGFPFSLFYRPDEHGITIFAVAHHARKPGYWRNRTKNA